MLALGVRPRRQPGKNDCMLTCLQMALEYRLGKVVKIKKFRSQLGHHRAVDTLELIDLALGQNLAPHVFGTQEIIDYGMCPPISHGISRSARTFAEGSFFSSHIECLDQLTCFIQDLRPVIALIASDVPNSVVGHAVLVVEIAVDSINYIDPAIGDTTSMNMEGFVDRWKAFSCFAIACLIPSDG